MEDLDQIFNSSIRLTLSTLSPMLNMVAPNRPAFIYNASSNSSQNPGLGQSSFGNYQGGSFALSFVGTDYSLHGTLAEPDGSAYQIEPSRPVGFNNVTTIGSQMTAILTKADSLGSARDLPLAAYQVRATFEADAVISLTNSTITIPMMEKEQMRYVLTWR